MCVIAAVSVVLPWSTCPIVPTFRCGFVLSNLLFAMTDAYTLKCPEMLVPMMWIEHMTSPLPRECSTTELHGREFVSLVPHRSLAGAGEGNRTLVISLEGFCSAIELHPPLSFTRLRSVSAVPHPSICWWRGLDSNQRRRKANRFTVCPL